MHKGPSQTPPYTLDFGGRGALSWAPTVSTTHDDKMMAAARAEIEELEALLETRRAALAWMEELVAKAEPEPHGRVRTLTTAHFQGGVLSRKRREKVSWGHRIDAVLRGASKPLSVGLIVKALKLQGAFEGISMVPANLVRANLKRSAARYGWHKDRNAEGVFVWSVRSTAGQEVKP